MWPQFLSLQAGLRDSGSPDPKSAASVYAQGGNEQTLTADLHAMVGRERSCLCMGADDAHCMRGGLVLSVSLAKDWTTACLFWPEMR